MVLLLRLIRSSLVDGLISQQTVLYTYRDSLFTANLRRVDLSEIQTCRHGHDSFLTAVHRDDLQYCPCRKESVFSLKLAL
jgi:hypothetical protein